MKDPFLERMKAATNEYAGMITELKVRLFSIRQLVNDTKEHHPQIVHEICDLQFRFCCEVIGIACLIAHGDLAVSKDARKAYEAPKMINELSKLHPRFFPQPVNVVWATSPGSSKRSFHLEDTTREAITHQEVVSLWHTLGANLHRGSLKAFRSRQRPLAQTYPDVEQRLARFEALIEHHTILGRNEDWVFICTAHMGTPWKHAECWLATPSDALMS